VVFGAPALPPAHVHEGTPGSAHAHVLIHRHFAPHTSPLGTHVGHPNEAEGAPHWLRDPSPTLTNLVSVSADATVVQWHVLDVSAHPGEYVIDAPEQSVHAPPPSPSLLRAPPRQS
jgi:hypothetical protein